MAQDVYLVHGWKLTAPEIKAALSDMPPEAFDRGVRVVFAEKSMGHAFVGEALLTLADGDGFAAVAAPSPTDVARIRDGVRAIGLGRLSAEEPKLWIVRG